MSLASFMESEHEADRLRHDALRVLEVMSSERERTEELLRQEPGGSFEFKFHETECIIRMLEGEWGLYGAGAAYLAEEDVGDLPVESPRIAPTLLLDPLWLARDLERLNALTPQLWAWQAEWARPRVEALLGHVELSDFVFQASAAPRPFAVAPGDGTKFTGTGGPPITGTLGPRVKFNQQDAFLTAGHVAPVDVATDPSRALVKVADAGGAVHDGTIQAVRHVAAYGSATGRTVSGDIDAALVTFDSTVALASGLGSAGQAAAASVVSKTGATTRLTQGTIASYLVWAGGKGVWRDCYGIVLDRKQRQFKRFAEGGDSGAGVTLTGGTVIGMVVGGAVRLPGCTQSVTYAQDIEEVEKALGCTVVP